MSDSDFIRWLRNWKSNLLELFVIAAIVASGLTTFKGAFHIFNQSLPVAALLTLFFQGGMYVIGHHATENPDVQRHRRALALCLCWIFLASFSVYSSALGMFEIQQESLRNDQTRDLLVQQWNESEKEIARFRTEALTEIFKARQTVDLAVKVERSRALQARRQRRSFSPITLQKLISEQEALKNAESRVREIKALSLAPPEETETARRALDEAFNSVKEVFATLTEEARSRIIVPSPMATARISEHPQKAFWDELLSGSTPVRLIVFFALMLDLLPPLVRFATAPKQTLPARIIRFRNKFSDLISAFRAPLSEGTESVKLTIQDMPALRVLISIPSARRGPLLDIERDFAQVTAEVSREIGYAAQLQSLETISGKSLVDGLPLLKQLGNDREVILRYAPQIEQGMIKVN